MFDFPIVLAAEDGGNFLVRPETGPMIWTLIAFGITLWILARYAFPYIQEALDRRIHKIQPDPDGTVSPNCETTTIAGSGRRGLGRGDFFGDGGQAINSRLNEPRGLVIAEDNTVFFADSLNHRIRMIEPGISGKVDSSSPINTIIGSGPVGLRSQTAALNQLPTNSIQLNLPTDVAQNGTKLIVADSRNHRIIKVDITFNGQLQSYGKATVIMGSGSDQENLPQHLLFENYTPATNVRLNQPAAIAVGPGGALIVADSHNHSIKLVGPTVHEWVKSY